MKPGILAVIILILAAQSCRDLGNNGESEEDSLRLVVDNWESKWKDPGLLIYYDPTPNNGICDGHFAMQTKKIRSIDFKGEEIFWITFSQEGPPIVGRSVPHKSTCFLRVSTNPLKIPITFWHGELSKTDLSELKEHWRQKIATANVKLLSDNKCGFFLDRPRFRQVIRTPTCQTLFSRYSTELRKSLREEYDYDTSSLNVYLQKGISCGVGTEKAIILPEKADWDLLLHEVGHCLGLNHAKNYIKLPMEVRLESIMKEDAGGRKYFTIGMILCMHKTISLWKSDSSIGDMSELELPNQLCTCINRSEWQYSFNDYYTKDVLPIVDTAASFYLSAIDAIGADCGNAAIDLQQEFKKFSDSVKSIVDSKFRSSSNVELASLYNRMTSDESGCLCKNQ